MHVFIAGSGKLATELLRELKSDGQFTFSPWSGEPTHRERSIVIHAGSGRQLASITEYCSKTASALIELATGSSLQKMGTDFPVVLCPNTNILMLKFMCMLKRSGHLFKNSEIRITESHQASKASTPGTAVAIADSLGVTAAEVVSVRNPTEQLQLMNIPHEHLSRHALHRIEIRDSTCQLTLETRVLGDSPYASGVRQITTAVESRALENRVYDINEFIENGWV